MRENCPQPYQFQLSQSDHFVELDPSRLLSPKLLRGRFDDNVKAVEVLKEIEARGPPHRGGKALSSVGRVINSCVDRVSSGSGVRVFRANAKAVRTGQCKSGQE